MVPSLLETFAPILRATREEKGWAQAELAENSRVALRTIMNLESPKGNTKVRFDVIVRLAHALSKPQTDWLKHTGHSQIPQTRIDQVLKKMGVVDFHGEKEPVHFFQSLDDKLQKGSPVIAIICYRTFSSYTHQKFFATSIAPLLDTGKLFLALVCPYPKIQDIDQVQKQTLSRIYSQVRSEVIGITKEVKTVMRNPQFRNHMAAFSLNAKLDNAVPPTLGLSEFRPILVQSFVEYSPTNKKPEYELTGWLTFLQDHKERWIHIFPAPPKLTSQQDAHRKICDAWKEYFQEILDNCNYENEGWMKDSQHWGIWDMADIMI